MQPCRIFMSLPRVRERPASVQRLEAIITSSILSHPPVVARLQTSADEDLGSGRNAALIDSLLSKAESGSLFTAGSGELIMPMLLLPCSKLLLCRCPC